jgi:eukaryotic-like serine/threonine-protein kinase
VIAIQIGTALDRAHRAGIAHRDLKPGNVMVVPRPGAARPDIKLLDFGLAARTSTTRPRSLGASLAETVAPSMVGTRPPSATVASGFSGTVQYMSPEQLDGDPGDQRADIFAFGCVLYEMLAGRKPFEGAAMVTVIAAIMSTEPAPIPALASHPLLDHVLRRCLEKDRERRWQSIGDVTAELRWISEHPPAALPAPAARFRRLAPVAIASAVLIAVIAVIAAVLAMRGRDTRSAESALTFEIPSPPTDDATLAVSPDGKRIAFVANQNGVQRLWVRSLDALENKVLPGTDDAHYPFWSPDGRSLAFFAGGKLKRTSVDGGTPLVLADAPNGRGGTWSEDGVILFAPNVQAPLMRVAPGGGAAESVATDSGTLRDHRWPQFLPGGKRFIFSSTLTGPEQNGVYVGSLDGSPAVRIMAGGAGRFAPPDRLLMNVQGTLQAFRFDPASSNVIRDEPVTVADAFTGGIGAMEASPTGVLAFRSGAAQRRQLVWVNRRGNLLRAIGEPLADPLSSPELSPDERSVAVFRHADLRENNIWVIELERNLARPITNQPPPDTHPLWDPDGEHVVFSSRGLTRQSITGGAPEPLFPNTDNAGFALSWNPNTRYILLRRDGEKTGLDLIARTRAGQEVVVSGSPADESEGQFSPDGRWVAFVSNDGGRPEVFVQSFPGGTARTQVSTSGGTQVRWSPDGREIFYVAPDGMMMAVPVTLTATLPDVKLPAPLFQTRLANGTNVLGIKPQYAVARDGRFLLINAVESASAPIVVLVNWWTKLAK